MCRWRYARSNAWRTFRNVSTDAILPACTGIRFRKKRPRVNPLRDAYVYELHQQFGDYYANWLPTEPLKLGDFGTLHDDFFRRRSNLSTIGIECANAFVTGPGANYNYVSSGSITVTSHARGALVPVDVPRAKAQLNISFSKKNSVYFNAAGCKINSISDQEHLGRQLVRRLKKAVGTTITS